MTSKRCGRLDSWQHCHPSLSTNLITERSVTANSKYSLEYVSNKLINSLPSSFLLFLSFFFAFFVSSLFLFIHFFSFFFFEQRSALFLQDHPLRISSFCFRPPFNCIVRANWLHGAQLACTHIACLQWLYTTSHDSIPLLFRMMYLFAKLTFLVRKYKIYRFYFPEHPRYYLHISTSLQSNNALCCWMFQFQFHFYRSHNPILPEKVKMASCCWSPSAAGLASLIWIPFAFLFEKFSICCTWQDR